MCHLKITVSSLLTEEHFYCWQYIYFLTINLLSVETNLSPCYEKVNSVQQPIKCWNKTIFIFPLY